MLNTAVKGADRGRFLLELYKKALTLPERELYDYFLDHAVRVTKSKIGFFHFVSNDQKTIILTTWNREALKNCTANYDSHYSIEKAGNWADCVRIKRPIIYNEFAGSPNQKGLPEGHVAVKRLLSVPIMENGKAQAIFGVGNKADPYVEEDVIQLDLVANELNKIIKQRWAENELRESREKYRSLFVNMLEGFAYCKMIFDDQDKPVDFVYLEVNDAFERLTGLKKDTVIGKRVTEAIPGIKEANPELFDIYGRVARTQKEEKFELFFKPLSMWLSISVYSPKREYFAAVFENITERKKAEEALRNAKKELEEKVRKRTEEVSMERQRLYSILETLPAYVVLLDKDYRVPFANKVFRERFGESHGKRCYEFLFKRNSSCEICETYKVLKTNKPHHWEWTGPDERNYDIYDFPFVEADGSTLILEMGIDITERKHAEKQIRDASLYSRRLIEASLDPLVTISAEGKITDVNRATETATGSSREELIGNDFSDYFTEPEKAKIGYERVFTDGFVRDYPLAIKGKSGKTTDVLYNATVYRNEAGEIQGVFAAARDVTELKKAEEEEREIAKKLKDTERLAAIGATAGMVGHDIRNPLQSIVGDLYLAKIDVASMPKSEEKDSVQESLQSIENSVVYINKIVADLQDFAKPLSPCIEETDLKQIINELLQKNGLPENIKHEVRVNSEARMIMADSAYIKRIIGNLVSNAVQAMPRGGELKTCVYREEQDAVITVEDTGLGIPEEAKTKLFTPLFTTKSKGQGFGLAVVKRLTEALGGTITFDSEVGKGTKFILHLPQQRNSH
jgi:PAS domain S-box-containing protein